MMPPIGEEKAHVRRRAEKLLQLLDAADTRAEAAVCLVTHKGWLREFEHGPLGRPHAAEFGDCELRVFELAISAGEVGVRCLHPREDEKTRLTCSLDMQLHERHLTFLCVYSVHQMLNSYGKHHLANDGTPTHALDPRAHTSQAPAT